MGRGKKGVKPSAAAGVPAPASASKKRSAADLDAEKDEIAINAPFLYQLINSLRDYHDTIEGDKQAPHSILQNQLTDKHPLCHLLITSSGSTSGSNEPAKSGDESSPVHHFVYWLFLATHSVQKLIKAGIDSDGTAVSAAWLVYTISQKLLSHLPSKQERLTSVAARHVVGRALILVSVAATEALSFLSESLSASTDDPSSESNTILSTSLQACVLALDSVTMVQHATSPLGPQFYWNQTVTSWSQSMDRVWSEHAHALQTIMAVVTVDWSLEMCSWQALSTVVQPMEEASAAPVASGKRASRRTTGTSASSGTTSDTAAEGAVAALLHTMEPLIKDDATHKIGLDSRLALKRWTAVGLTWYGISGQEKLLMAAHRLLQPDAAVMFSECWRPVVLGPLPEQVDQLSLDDDSSVDVYAFTDDPPEKVKPPKKVKQSDENMDTSVADVGVPHNVTLLTMVCRLCRIVSDIGNAAGSRPPAAGGYDTYLKGVTGTVVKKSKKLIRAELRDLAMSISYLLIHRHHKCLKENYGTNRDKLVINEDTAEDFRRRPPSDTSTQLMGDDHGAEAYRSLYFYYPYVHKAVGELASAAASNAGGGHSVSLITAWTDRIEYAASSFVFSTQNEIVDARLTSYALGKLVLSLSASPPAASGISADTATSSTAVSASGSAAAGSKKKRPSFKLDEALPIPSIIQHATKQNAVRKRKGAASASAAAKDTLFCSFGGIYEDRTKGEYDTGTEFTCDDKLALFIRAVQGEPALVSHLIWLVESCYNTSTIENPAVSTLENSLSASSGDIDEAKRKSTSSPSGRANKRRKQSAIKAKTKNSAVHESKIQCRPIKGPRAIVSTKALDALRLFIRDPTDRTLSDIQATLSNSLTIDHMHRVIELGSSLEAICSTSVLKRSVSEDVASASLRGVAPLLGDDVTDLWMSHIELCLAIGKGLSSESSFHSAGPDLRQKLFEKIARDSKRQSSRISWPLALRPAHRVLVLASLTTGLGKSDATASDELSPEGFIVSGFLAELAYSFKDLGASFDDESPTLDGCPVSLQDARVFLGAFSKLSLDTQESTLFELLTLAYGGLNELRSTGSPILERKEVCHFLARMVTCCVSAYCVIKFGAGIQTALDEVISKSLSAKSQMTSRGSLEESNGDRCFMSVFTDGEDSGLPPGLVSQHVVAKATDELLQQILENALSLGYTTATLDGCHLLYAAWNALGKCDLWNDLSNGLHEFNSLPEDATCIILQLRDEMCLVNYSVNRLQGEIDLTSTLMRARDTKARLHRASKAELKGLLQGMIRKGCSIVDAILQKYAHTDATNLNRGPPIDVFCLLEACCVYISMAVSQFTTPKHNYFSTMVTDQVAQSKGRTRGYSTDSEAMPSDVGSVASRGALADAVERFQEACDYLGAVPAHPDWLDKDCTLMEYVSTSDALEIANEAMACLTRLVSAGLTQSQSSSRRALTQALDPKNIGTASMISHLCELDYMNDSMVTNAELSDHAACVGAVCDLDSDFLLALFERSVSLSRIEAMRIWCPFSAQRIIGKFRDVFLAKLVRDVGSPELRACGEWEVLLARSLSSACISTSASDSKFKFREVSDQLLVNSERWLDVCRSALDSLVSTAALVRFGITATGRLSHPLSFTDATTDSFEASKGSLTEPMPSSSSLSDTLKRSVHSTLATVARFPSSTTCDAIATHLVVDFESISTLKGMLISTVALRTLSELRKIVRSKKRVQTAPVSLLVQRSAAALGAVTISVRDFDSFGSPTFSCLFACLVQSRNQATLSFDTIAANKVDPLDILSINSTTAGSDSADGWDWEDLTSDLTSSVVFFVCHDCLQESPSTRRFLASVLSTLIAKEIDGSREHVVLQEAAGSACAEAIHHSPPIGLLASVLHLVDEMPESSITKLIQDDICGSLWCKEVHEELFPAQNQNSFASLFALLLSSGNSTEFKRMDLVLSVLLKLYDKWKNSERSQRNAVLSLTMIYATRLGELAKIGERIFEDLKRVRRLKSEDATAMENMMFFAEFVRELSDTLLLEAATKCDIGPIASLPASCSYAIKTDFHEQHWYNCFTCGLTNDKGCCTLCAVVCHQGHDVVYARHSSFFCDCGSGEESTIKSCRCLSSHSSTDLAKQFREGTYSTLVSRGHSDCALSPQLSALIIKDSFPQVGVTSFNNLMTNVGNGEWVRCLFEYTEREFCSWKTANEEAEVSFSARNRSLRYGNLRTSLSQQLSSQSNPWKIQGLDTESYTLLGTSRSGSFQMRMSNHRTTDRKGMYRHGIGRCAIDADSRGRIAIAESSDVSFGTCLPFVNSTNGEGGVVSYSRSAMMSGVSKLSVGFRVAGVKFAFDCENLVCVWSAREAKVIFIANGLASVDRASILELDLSSDEDSVDIVTCYWLEGSGTGLVVGCSKCLFVFDVSHQKGKVAPLAKLPLTQHPSNIRDFAVVRISDVDDDPVWNLFVLLENGKVHEATVSLASPNDAATIHQDPSKANEFLAAAMDDTSVEVVSLTFLAQSCLILCETRSSGTLALVMDEKGDVLKAVKFLPFNLDASLFGERDESGYHGPFTQWRELGIVCRGSETFFRLSFVGFRSTAAPVFLYIEFNESGVSVRDFVKNVSDPPESYEGFAVFTAPVAFEEKNSPDYSESRLFGERIVLCAISLDGCMQLYAEQGAAPSRAAFEPEGRLFHGAEVSRTPTRTFEYTLLEQASQLISIEKLKNVTLSQKLVFGSTDLGSSENIKDKLVEAESCLTSPRTEGFTLSVAMVDQQEDADPLEYSLYGSPLTQSDDVAIAALRIHVGSGSLDRIPQSVRVMGRTYNLTAGQKRWYTFQLSAQEIACAIRNGFVSILVHQCTDSSIHPALDSIEVHAVGRRDIERWLPFSLHSMAEMIPINGEANIVIASALKSKYEVFRQCVTALGNLSRAMRGAFQPNRAEKSTVEHLITDAALTVHSPKVNESIDCLLYSLYRDEESRQTFYDKAVLAGCTAYLSKCQRTIEKVKGSGSIPDFRMVWCSLIPSVRFCLRTAARIARARPFNYVKGIDGSIAADASKFVIECRGTTIADDDLVSDFVELSLLETAVANGTPRGNLGSLSGLRSLLASPTQAVVLQTCSSISRFCRMCDLFAAPTMAVEYVCDSCFDFINDTRFTLLEHDHAFDLCPVCYHIGQDYVRANEPNDDDHVIIKGKAVGDNPKLTCGEFKILQPVAIKKAFADAETTASTQSAHPMGLEVAHKHQLFNDFMDCLSNGIAGLIVDELKKPTTVPTSLVWLAVDLVRHSLSNGRKVEKATQLAEALATRACSNLRTAIGGEDWSGECLILLEALICLFVPDSSARDYLLGNQQNFVNVDGISNSEVSCTTHGARVKLRRFTEGRNKGRCFYCCTKDSRHDCNFFLWAEENGELLRNDKQAHTSVFTESVATFVWELLVRPLSSDGTTLNSVLCSFVEKFWDSSSIESDSTSKDKKGLVHYTRVDLQKGYADGVMCQHGRLRDDVTSEGLMNLWRRSRTAISDGAKNNGLVGKCLELVALCARADTEGTAAWFPVLCRIMLPPKDQNSKADKLRSLAKRSLKQLCGNNSALSHAVRDHFVFAFHVEKLLRYTGNVLQCAVMLNEKARQCGASWKSNSPVAYQSLTLSQFIGTHSLISEDTNTLQVNEKASKTLQDLLAVANKRGCSWRRFCGLPSIPACVSSSLCVDFTATSPLSSLFAVACTTSTENQVALLRLINLALARSVERKPAIAKAHDGAVRPKGSDEEADTSDAITARLAMFYADSATPEEILSVSSDDVCSFSLRFVCHGQTADLRSLACSVAKKLCRRFDKPSLAAIFDQLSSSPLSQTGQNGRRSAEFMTLLQAVLSMAGREVLDVARYAALFQSYWKQQVLAIRHDRANGEFIHLETTTSTSIQKKRYSLSSCATCRFHESRTKDHRTEKATPTSTRASATTTTVAAAATEPAKLKWLPEQVTSFTKFRLDLNRESTSNEFSSFFLLKHRCVLSAIQVEVENPRRFVKTINFYYSPRPVENAVVLKSSQFADNWQHCGVLTLTRGTTRGSLTLKTPVVAANLKIEYADFYERPGSTKSSDGTLVIHCPRCTRVVTNAHGVCGNCGEVAFQCRKCRHINYDRLDAFLCVECGYCASGTFQFDLTAAVATNAVAVMNDRDYERSMHRKLVASKLHGELKSALVQKLRQHVQSRRKNPVEDEDEERMGLDILPAFKRAFTGALPLEPGETEFDFDGMKVTLSQLGKPGSIVKTVAQTDSEGQSRPQSLFRSRASSSTRSRTESMFRMGDGDETASELLGGLLESTSTLSRFASLDPSDPLSRLLASVQSRRERRETDEAAASAPAAAAAAASGTSAVPSRSTSGMSKDDQDVCDRLFQLMREAEREAHELETKCAAWRRLEQGSLEIGNDTSGGFEPSHCAMCAVPLAAHLLVLWLRTVQLDPDAVAMDADMIHLLVQDEAALHPLVDAKRSAVKELALVSRDARPLILHALRVRLMHWGHDVGAAEILGQILQNLTDADAAAPFLALAHEALESGLS